ncbi:cyclic di-AMP binding protein CbpA [Evansella cellulosilytica]|uniref:CBS domain containing protein n=1 Tax=Evansella cellulosilytica (strain ATCC 21833 / DSM 2522 / FERM P-1141 / JCM 9156 / N-4) TaxID=649639 RepID=E6TZL0_EVAC2|nr:cyclic di-AMP binding protein CbpA [Evansella cellulosilytica]ADU30184.1 CBS domain containing protein [Evansella cellulosilytica DSM 2522]
MKIKYNIIPKQDVRFVKENFSIQEALIELEESGFRCIPILDESSTYYKGNIYVQDVYRALYKETHKLQDSVMTLKDDVNVTIEEQSSFFKVFNQIKKYPYLAVLQEDNTFAGILTHANVMSLLEDSWGVKTGSYTINISTHEYHGALSLIVSSIKKITGIQSLLTLDNESRFFRRVIVTLPRDTSEETLNKVVSQLESDGLRVFDIEKI